MNNFVGVASQSISRGHHPRALANHVLDLGIKIGLNLTNMSLQKLLYYAHGWYLASTAKPLVRGGFQAWEHGPVSRSVYSAFKSAGDKPIEFRATVINFNTGEEVIANAELEDSESTLLHDVLRAYGHLHPFELSRRTHEIGSPWHNVWMNKTVVPGMQISDELIKNHFLNERFAIKN